MIKALKIFLAFFSIFAVVLFGMVVGLPLIIIWLMAHPYIVGILFVATLAFYFTVAVSIY